jgi:hypothetical protein
VKQRDAKYKIISKISENIIKDNIFISFVLDQIRKQKSIKQTIFLREEKRNNINI